MMKVQDFIRAGRRWSVRCGTLGTNNNKQSLSRRFIDCQIDLLASQTSTHGDRSCFLFDVCVEIVAMLTSLILTVLQGGFQLQVVGSVFRLEHEHPPIKPMVMVSFSKMTQLCSDSRGFMCSSKHAVVSAL